MTWRVVGGVWMSDSTVRLVLSRIRDRGSDLYVGMKCFDSTVHEN